MGVFGIFSKGPKTKYNCLPGGKGGGDDPKMIIKQPTVVSDSNPVIDRQAYNIIKFQLIYIRLR